MALAGSLVPFFAPQQPGRWTQDAQPVPDVSWRKSSGDFGAMMLLTDRYQDFVKEWEKPDTPNLRPPSGPLHRGQSIVAVVLFAGCKAKNERCESTVDFRVLKPDGSTYAERSGLVLWDGPPPAGRNLQLSRANLGIGIEPTDPLGEYRITAVVADRVADAKVTLDTRFSVAP
jgi:hypothetical protein